MIQEDYVIQQLFNDAWHKYHTASPEHNGTPPQSVHTSPVHMLDPGQPVMQS